MSYDILGNGHSRHLFEKINRRELCDECHWERSSFADFDKKGNPPQYSNLLPGFSSEKVDVPLDILVVGEAHGGGRKDDFRPQLDLDSEVCRIFRYYATLPDKTFHQAQIRVLLNKLDDLGVMWVFTDLIKCFVWYRSNREKSLDGTVNKRIAISYCRRLLEEQLSILQPKCVIGLGNTVAEFFGLKKPGHGSSHTVVSNAQRFIFIYSLFPSQWTADQWVRREGWEPVMRGLSKIGLGTTS